MIDHDHAAVGEPDGLAHGRPGDGMHPFQRNRTEGHVIYCNGEHAIIAAVSGRSSTASEDYWAVGQPPNSPPMPWRTCRTPPR